MLTLQDFVEKYETYTDDELYKINATINDYSEEAKNALKIVLDKRGGLDPIMNRMKEQQLIDDEIKRIARQADKLSGGGTDAAFLKTLIKSELLSEQQVHEIIDARFSVFSAEEKDKAITSNTIAKSVIGCVIATIIGSTLWSLQLVYSSRIFYILGVALIMCCYGIIRYTTRHSSKNKAVLITTIIAVVLSIGIGQIVFEIVGYQP